MADIEGLKVSKDYHVEVPFANQKGFFLKGINSLDWGMTRHMANIFNPGWRPMWTASWAPGARCAPAYRRRR